MAYAAFGASKTNYKQNGAISAQVLNSAGDFKTVMGQLAFDVEKRSGELGLKGKLDTGPVKHQWALNATHYSHAERLRPPHRAGRGLDHQHLSPGLGRCARLHRAAHLQDQAAPGQLRPGRHDVVRRGPRAADAGRAPPAGDQRHHNIKTGDRTSRYDESATTPAAAILVKVTDRVSVYANYIEGLSQGATAPMTAANAGDVFAPYKTKQKEIGLKLDLGDFAHTVSLYEISAPTATPIRTPTSFHLAANSATVAWNGASSARRGPACA